MAVMRIGLQCLPPMKISLASDSAEEAMTFLMVFQMACNGALVMVFLTVDGSWPKMYQAVDRLRYLVRMRYADSDSRVRIISLA